jgi:hypothetical protein
VKREAKLALQLEAALAAFIAEVPLNRSERAVCDSTLDLARRRTA